MLQIRNVLHSEMNSVVHLIQEEMILLDKSSIEKDELTSYIITNSDHFVGCYTDNTLVGCGCAVLENDACLINWIYVKKAYQRDHIGTAILKYLLNRAEMSGIKIAYLIAPCIQFAEKNGFEKLANTKDANIMFSNNYGYTMEDCIYCVSLYNYFKPCCGTMP